MRSSFVSIRLRAARFRRNHFVLRLAALALLLAPDTPRAQYISYAGVQTVLPATGLSNPTGVAIDASGNRYIVENALANVIEIAVNGTQSTISLNSSLDGPRAIAVDAAGNLYSVGYE